METALALAIASVAAFGAYYAVDPDGFMNLVDKVQSAFAGNGFATEPVSGS